MSPSANTMEIFKLLDRSNCRECNEPTCLAFAAAVFKGQRQLSECPRLDRQVAERFGGKPEPRVTSESELESRFKQMKAQVAAIDLASAADRVGATVSDSTLTIKILGKNFSVDSKGNLASEIHIHPWVAIPVLNHILVSKGTALSGRWVPLRELEGGKNWYRLFEQRCEKPLKRVADNDADLFEYMVRVFNGKQVENHYQSDVSLVLSPLPKVPILICYWRPEEELESDLNVFFDATVEDHLNIESVYALGTGLVIMFEKIALTHSFRY